MALNGKWEENISWEMVLIRLGKVDIKSHQLSKILSKFRTKQDSWAVHYGLQTTWNMGDRNVLEISMNFFF